jgi:hypothetical protein
VCPLAHVFPLLLGFGSGSGLVLHTAAQWMSKSGYLLRSAKLNRNTLFLSVLGGGALGSFIFATTMGKKQVHNLHSIFQVGANPKGGLDYQQTLQKARERGEDTIREAPVQNSVDLEKLEQNCVIRRRTVNDSIRTGHGLSDSHGGHWVPEDGKLITDTGVPAAAADGVDIKTLQQIRLLRRKSVSDSLQSGRHGLSDSHGGRWVQGEQKQP